MTVYSTTTAVELSCTSKKRYDTEYDAEKVAARVFAIRLTALRVYPCFECGGYHLTRRNAERRDTRGWRPPAKSQRAIARERKMRRRRR